MTDTTTGVAASTDTHCPYCALQCAMTLTRADGAAEGAAPVVVAGRDFPTNRGGLCKKGWTSAELLRSPDRLTDPARARRRRRAARDRVGCRARPHRAIGSAPSARRTARDAVAVFGGGGPHEREGLPAGQVRPRSRSARAASTTTAASACRRPPLRATARSASTAGCRSRSADLDAASTVLLLGTNVAATMPPFIGHLTGAQDAGGLIVVDPRRTATVRLTDEGRGIHLQPTPGTDLALLLGLHARRDRRRPR